MSLPSKAASSGWFSGINMGPPDAIFGVTEAFRRDKNPNKVNLGVGAYRDDNTKPYILPCVRKAEENIKAKNLDKEYPAISGDPEFCKLASELAFGQDSEVICNGLNATVQGIAGCGSLRIGAAFLKDFFPGNKTIYLSSPTWANHIKVFTQAGLKTDHYKYYDPKTIGLDFQGFLQSLCAAPDKSIICLHACAHNPTGIDPSKEQWQDISLAIKEKNHYPFFDMAYQGFATGDNDNDAYAVRLFAKDKHQLAVAQSFSKNMGLYGERIGALTLVASGKEEVEKIMSNLKILIRGMYSNPPFSGARIVKEVLGNEELRCEWLEQVKGMADRIISVRNALKENLKKEGSTKNWDHITNQIGMFCYTGLTPEQVDKLTKEHSVFLTKDGRISMASVSSKNVNYIAKAIHAVTK